MTANQYIQRVINNKKSKTVSFYDTRLTEIKNIIRKWAGSQLATIKLSGSCAKGTAIKGKSDCDLFISLKSDTNATLKEIYYSLNEVIENAGYSTRLQNVSIGIKTNGLDIDLVPARIQTGYKNYHSLYLSKKDSWAQTNIDVHIKKVLQTGRQQEIIATKIWRTINDLKFPSIYLDMVVVEVLKYYKKNQPAKNFLTVLEYLKTDFINHSFIDYSNSNNIVSGLIYKYQKEEIKRAAKISLFQTYWKM